MLREMNLDTFVNELASESPAPGGGSAAGLAASLGASLTSMVFNLTIDNKASDHLSPEIIDEMRKAREDMLRIKTEFIDLMEKDTASFTRFMDALNMPKGTDEEKAVRKEKLDQAKIDITETPERVAILCSQIWDAVELANDYGNVNAVSDAGVAALMLDAAIKSSLLNVKINLPMIKDEAKKAAYVERMNGMLAESTERSNKIYSSVSNKLDA
ncbi:MAG: cyclodeaminase/cyclohydrolase family protein [Clostridium sp.]|jgi:formiminotetrahydrofolate cyclodeaminase|nr:cyclodeaminase/cyclohydrolase family protein [Clostridium sp.]